ncbi:hypothetical protein M436DRAFT_46972 [Aureobasidium namibiae CBS 147.97]|uniref:Uncharacterized protein n=1 Tax=Aureobasidium namibiae CBS 147.97 TaxID=1043004 RepID=A0A074WTC5_9PEZI|nr:uncharacterized protein M436DRAFT_46972 [Aureobasidium namibiae CBS 147.97]KEQ73012.1 hypothetical protein M436DRAFT_46972 [Aureobasidium namibiae CBS 147.97]
MMKDATTPPPPSSRLRTPPTPKHGAGYHSYDPYEPRRSQRVQRLHNIHDKESTSSSSRKSTLQRSSSTYTLSPPASPAVDRLEPQQTPARPTPVRQSLFTRNRPTNTPNPNTTLFDFFAPQAQLPTPASMLPTPNKSPFKRDSNAMQSTARILNFKPQSTMPTPRKKAKSRLTLDDDDAVHEEVQVFTDIQDRIPTVDRTEDNPFIGPRKTRARTRAQTAPSSSTDADMEDDNADDDKGILYVFRGKKIFRRFEKAADEHVDSDASSSSIDSLKRKAGVSASRPLTRSSFKPRLLWPSANSDGDADEEEALTDIDEDNVSAAEPTLFAPVAQTDKTPSSKKVVAHPATPPSSHRNTRSAAQQIAIFADPHNELNRAIASPSTTPMPQKPSSGPLFAGWPRSKTAEEKAARGEKRPRTNMSEPDLPAKRARSTLF